MDFGLFLAFFWLLFHLLPFSAHEDWPSPSACPATFSCENLELMNSKFPTNGSHPYCDLCTVECKAKLPPKIALSPATHWFDVMSINDSTVKLRDSWFQSLLYGETCEPFEYDIGLPDPDSNRDTILQTITLFKCNITNSEPSRALIEAFSGFKNYDKCNHHPGFTIYYQNPPDHAPPASLDRLNCTYLNFPLVYSHPENIELFQLLTAEFDIEWHLFHDCYECHREGYCETEWKEKSGCAPTNAPKSAQKKGTKKDMVIVVGTATPVAGLVILVILAYCFRRKFSFSEFCSSTEKFKNVEAFLKNYGSLAPKRYHYSDIKKMTNSFKTKLGQGGYGCVYKGKLHDGSPVAVKVLKESKGSGEEFINEVASISRTSHVNIVTLLGFCFQGRKRALIYEFMPNGSLDKFIFGGTSSTGRQLGFQSLYKIAFGIARGLEYLHRGCNTRIVHLDIKPHNILLDENFCPKISDFGLAKLCTGKESIVSILGTRGTFGYIAPEVCCKSFGGVSHKSDVYSYGMMIFEMVGGRKNIQVEVDHSSEIYFPDWIYRRIDKGDNLGLEIMNEEEDELARKMIIVSLWCIQTDPSSRPSITKVLEMLEGSLQALQIPPKPFLSSPSRASDGFATVNIT